MRGAAALATLSPVSTLMVLKKTATARRTVYFLELGCTRCPVISKPRSVWRVARGRRQDIGNDRNLVDLPLIQAILFPVLQIFRRGFLRQLGFLLQPTLGQSLQGME